MRKNLLLIIVVICSVFVLSYVLTPKVVYGKVNKENDIDYNNQSIDSLGEIENEESSRIVILQLYLDYEYYGSSKNYKNSYATGDHNNHKKVFRDKAKKYHEGNNNSIIKKIDLGNYQELYVSKYSPYIDITYDYDYYKIHELELLSNITKNKFVKSVNVIEEEIEYINCITSPVYACGLEPVYESRSKTGTGVVVGILEPGVIKTNDAMLANTDITIRSSAYNLLNKHDHTTYMAKYIAGSTGIAPGASLLNAYLSGTMENEIDWMIENDVDIINMSFGVNNNYGEYDSYSAYADYIAYTYDIIMVSSAGNRGEDDGYITNPALGYNVITVGSAGSAGYVADYSSYDNIDGPIKPTICIPGTGIYVTDDPDEEGMSGTSVSSALCSGMIALLLEDYPELASEQERLLTLMIANALWPSTITAVAENGFSEYLGAGIFNYQNIIDHYYTAFNYTNTNGTPNTIFKQRMIYLTQGQTLRTAFAHLVKTDGTVDGYTFTDYDLFIKDSNGVKLQTFNETSTNIMLSTFVAPSTGYYKIEVLQYSEVRDTTDYTSLAYAIID